MTKIQNISVTLPTQLENILLSWLKLAKWKDKETFLREELERMLVDRMVEELEDYNAAVEALSSWEENITLESIEKKYNLA